MSALLEKQAKYTTIHDRTLSVSHMRPSKIQKVGGEIEIADRMNPSVISLLKMFIYMTFIAHILGCLWHWIVTFEDDGINWVSYFGVEEVSVDQWERSELVKDKP